MSVDTCICLYFVAFEILWVNDIFKKLFRFHCYKNIYKRKKKENKTKNCPNYICFSTRHLCHFISSSNNQNMQLDINLDSDWTL